MKIPNWLQRIASWFVSLFKKTSGE